MSTGVYILSQVGTGDTFEGLPGDLECAITEIRVEQHLARPSTFAIRLQEDFEDGEAKSVTADNLRGGKGLAILVDGGTKQPPRDGLGSTSSAPGKLICLIRGQVENSQADLSVGGSGSWYEVRGRDVRTLAARDCGGAEFTGTTTEIAEKLTKQFTKGTFHQSPPVAEFKKEEPYRFYGTWLGGLENLSTLCDSPVRLAYQLKPSSIAVNLNGLEQFEVTVDVYFEPSPAQSGAAGAAVDLLSLVTDEMPYLRIMGSEGACENVVNFSLQNDTEAITSVSSAVVDPDSGEAVLVDDQKADQTSLISDAEDPNTKGAPDGNKLQITKAGHPDLAAAAARAAANEASWYVKANALTTAHMLGKVLQPHDLVEVIGGGCGINGVFQVEKVVHVINSAAHWMHLDLRGNSRSLKPAKEGLLDA